MRRRWVVALGSCWVLGCASGASPKPEDAGRPRLQDAGMQPSKAGAAPAAGKAGKGAGGETAGRSGSAGERAPKAGAAAAASMAGKAGSATAGAPASGDHWKPKPGTSWQWQLTGKLDTSFDVTVYDIDLYETKAEDITALHAQSRKVICYFDTAYEPNRPDSAKLQPFRGNPIDGWPGQYWVDVRAPEVLEVMLARLDLAQSKGCDGVEADDIDARSNKPGFPISAAEQQAFIIAIAEGAHARGMAFGLKNDLEEIPKLIVHADFAINEQCFEYDECDTLAPFISAGKAVFNVEYAEGSFDAKAKEICGKANALNFDSLVKHLDLGPERRACR